MGRLILLCLVMMLVPEAARAQRARPCLNAILVVDFDGGAQHYRLLRGGRRLPLSILAPLRHGDEIQVLAPSRTLTVQLANRSIRSLTAGDGRQCIRQERRTIVSNGWMRLGDLLTARRFTRWHGLARGDGDARQPLSIGLPDVAAGTALVAGGERRLALVWHGGEPPFLVDVTGPDGGAIIHEERVYQRFLLVEAPRRLGNGVHRVRISDAVGAAAEGRFRAGDFPPAFSAPDSAGAALLGAAALYEAGPDRAFDAFMLLSPYFEEQSTVGWMMVLLTELRKRERERTH